MNRKQFIQRGCAACIAATGVASLLQACSFTKYSGGVLEKNGLRISKDEFKLKDNESTAYRSFIIIKNDALKYPVCVYRFTENQYTALWMQCSHQGAELQALGDKLVCPAHGSEFDNKGEVSNGPANNPLRNFPVIVSETDLFIDMRKKA